MKPLPSRNEIAGTIQALIAGQMSRDEVSAWAMSVVLNDDYSLSDQVSWKVINALGGVDTPSTDRPYLYDRTDFQGWLASLQ